MLRRLAFAAAMIAVGSTASIILVSNASAEEIKVVGVYSAPVQQKWVATLHRVLTAAQRDRQISYSFAEGLANPADYLRVMRQYVGGGADLVIGEGFAIPREG